jgi:hypothetical protein
LRGRRGQTVGHSPAVGNTAPSCLVGPGRTALSKASVVRLGYPSDSDRDGRLSFDRRLKAIRADLGPPSAPQHGLNRADRDSQQEERHGCGCVVLARGHVGLRARRPTILRRHILPDETRTGRCLQHSDHEPRYFTAVTIQPRKVGNGHPRCSPEGQRGLHHAPDVRIDEVQRSLC